MPKKEEALAMVKADGWRLDGLSDDLKKDPDVVKAAFIENPLSLGHAAQSLKENADFILDLLRDSIKPIGIFRVPDEEDEEDEEDEKLEVENNYFDDVLKHADQTLKEDKEFILKAIRIDPKAFQYADQTLKKDKKFILKAIEITPNAFQYAAQELQTDESFILEASDVLKQNHSKWDKNPEAALAVVKINGLLLGRVDKELIKNYPEILYEAVRQNSDALELVGKQFRMENRDIVLEAVKRNGRALYWVKSEVTEDAQDFFYAAVDQDGSALEFVPREFQKSHPDIVELAVRQYGWALKSAAPELKKDRGIVELAVQQDGLALEYAAPELKKDRALVELAVQQDALALQFADPELKKDRDIVELAVRQNALALEYVDKEFQKKHPDIVLEAVRQNGLALEYVDDTLKNDPTFFWKVWNIKSDQADEIRASYTRKFLLKEILKFMGGAGLAITGGLMLGSIIALPLAPLAVLIGGVIAAIGALITLHTVMRLHTVAAFKEQLKELKNTDEARKQQPDEANEEQVVKDESQRMTNPKP